MDTLKTYRRVIREVLTPYAETEYSNVNSEIHNQLICDEEGDHYMVLSMGWAEKPERRIGRPKSPTLCPLTQATPVCVGHGRTSFDGANSSQSLCHRKKQCDPPPGVQPGLLLVMKPRT